MPTEGHAERSDVQRAWEEAFGAPPPRFLSHSFMQRALIHDAQCRRHGSLPAKTLRTLRRLAEDAPTSRIAAPDLRPGAHLVREWNGRSYQVEVIEGGYRMDGRTWTSLSALARHITGTTWSGPRFFGLSGRRKIPA
ncbi:hypothetical protein ROJ8625_00406 [Roseivivax jejudonensis]|uniref:DUF2924 domain-containing protein n=1 Tax=Roseivivax jejudonensis TaxID=1529041 RepID=A0A1X6Y819_9RHOB|nr:DUF2924 domain-containing protein [Roseivivax jejudonensis]SLN13477.1 hypothetical protein ROJ8625_00406 [Roseivivax jejudonensis]